MADAPRSGNRGFVPPRPHIKARIAGAAILLIAAGAVTPFAWNYLQSYQSTDDAQIDGHIDPLSSRRLDDLILELRDSLGATMVVVTHELPSIFAIADNAVFLDGETRTMIAVGNPKTLRDECPNPVVRTFLRRGEPDSAAGGATV